MRVIFVVKLLFTFGLFVVFFTIFGMSSIQKYIKGDIVTVSRTEPNDDCLPLPAMMVCPEGKYGGAWKKCCDQYANNLTKMDVCSRNNAYTLDETILKTTVNTISGDRADKPFFMDINLYDTVRWYLLQTDGETKLSK